jgi:hypothetical protein
MPRKRSRPEDLRRHVIHIRLNDGELVRLKKLAHAAGLPYERYAREIVLGHKPRTKPLRTVIFQKLVYELQSIATNFQQLADATDDDYYATWARYTGGDLVAQLIGRHDLADIIEQQLQPINLAGQVVNSLARKGNVGFDIERDARRRAFMVVRDALEPLQRAVEKSPSHTPVRQPPRVPPAR